MNNTKNKLVALVVGASIVVPSAFAADPDFSTIATAAQSSYLTFLSTAAGPILGICLVVGGFSAIKRLVSRGVR